MGKVIVLGDFAEQDRLLQAGAISQEEYQKFFERTRLHGFKGDIFPFALGGSDVAAVMGISPWITPVRLYREKTGLLKTNASGKKLTFLAGHLLEDPVRQLFAEKTGLRTEACSLQVKNSDYPHLVANIDGIVWKNEEPGIYEGKTTAPFTPTKTDFVAGIVPPYYMTQIQFYMEIWNLDFAYINCAWGFNPKSDMRHIRVERDHVAGKEICTACETFITNAMHGIAPTNAIVENAALAKRDAIYLYGKGDPSQKPVSIPSSYEPSFHKLDKLSESEKDLKAQIAEAEKAIKPLKDALTRIAKEQNEILNLFPDILKESTQGHLSIGENAWVVHYDPSDKFSLDVEVREYWKNNYPACYEDISQQKPAGRKLSYEKVQKE